MDSISESLASPGVSGTPIPGPFPLDPIHEAFAQAISLGEEPAAACQRLFRCKTATTAEKKAAALLADSAISARIACLQREASHIATHHAHFTKADLIAFLVETIQTPVSSIDQHHRQCQEWTRDELSATGRRANASTQQKTQNQTQTSSAKGSTTKGRRVSKSKTITVASAHHESEAAGEGISINDSSVGTDSELPRPTPILLRSKTKVPSKLDAAKLLATLCGWHAPAKLEGNVSLGLSPTVEEALSRLLK